MVVQIINYTLSLEGCMDIYGFIDLPEVAKYMRKRRTFTPTEMVSIIAHSSASIETQTAATKKCWHRENGKQGKPSPIILYKIDGLSR